MNVAIKIRDYKRFGITAFSLLLVVYFLYGIYFIYSTSFVINGTRYFCLFDDAMISMRYARNLAEGHGLRWNPGGEYVEGYSNFLFVLYMALVHLLPIDGSKVSLIIQLTELILVLYALSIIRKIAEFVAEGSKVIVTSSLFLTAFYYPINNFALQGMDVGPILVIMSLVLLESLRCLQSKVVVSNRLLLLLGIGSLLRVDFLINFLAVPAFLLIARKRFQAKRIMWVLLFIVIFVGGQTLFRYWNFGEFLPNTYYLKVTGISASDRIMKGLAMANFFIRGISVIPFLFAILALIIPKKQNEKLLLAYVFIVQLAYSIYVGGDVWSWFGGADRYVSVVMPFFLILLCYGIFKPLETIPIEGKRLFAFFVCMNILLSISLNTHNYMNLDYVLLKNPPLHVEMHPGAVIIAKVLREVTFPNATITVWRAGITPYFSNRTFIDLLGKNDAKIARERMQIKDWREFHPGHNKWNYTYSIGEKDPDIIYGVDFTLIRYIPDIQKEYISHRFILPTGNEVVFLKKSSPNILWDKLGKIEYNLETPYDEK
ncbi:MAG: hypothetical protein ABH950_04655 [Candidatus Altiarchaeota archaeon]